ncbi:hypothetical protein [Halotalea alkalilenta]|uniref:hypothetical protein n=1 Tax=Halotalea alkalilenta TaxID=376489 RepID=UPI0012DF0AC0|nr:hypothetical protein [Halotalea alkalilenta]
MFYNIMLFLILLVSPITHAYAEVSTANESYILTTNFPSYRLSQISTNNSMDLFEEIVWWIKINGNERLRKIIIDESNTEVLEENQQSQDIVTELVTTINGEITKWEMKIKLTESKLAINVSFPNKENFYLYGMQFNKVEDDVSLLGYTIPTREIESYPGRNRNNLFYNNDMKIWIYPYWDLNGSSVVSKNPDSVNIYNDGKNHSSDSIDINEINFPQLYSDTMSSRGWDGTIFFNPTEQRDLPINETLYLNFSPDLWKAVPVLDNERSQYYEKLKNTVYLDFWGGEFELGHKLNDWILLFLPKSINNITIIQNWQEGGFDSHQPLSYVPNVLEVNENLGSKVALKEWVSDAIDNNELIGLRTNYLVFKNNSLPKIQKSNRAIDAYNNEKWHTSLSQVGNIAEQQERNIKDGFMTNATFSDQLSSGGGGFPYIDYSTILNYIGVGAVRNNLTELANTIKHGINGPLLSESLNSEYLLGYVDGGDYGLFSGHSRFLIPDYKLMRLHNLAVAYGVGLGYRFYFAPPYQGNKLREGNIKYNSVYSPYSDDYRSTTILYGNAGYIYFYPWLKKIKVLSEYMTTGVIQAYYLGQGVDSILHYTGNEWLPLDQVWLRNEYESMEAQNYTHIRYRNGFNIVVNRGISEKVVSIPSFGDVRLPQYSYAAFFDNGSVIAFSGIPSNNNGQRIDYTKDDNIKMEYIDPRGSEFNGVKEPTVYQDGTVKFSCANCDETFDYK